MLSGNADESKPMSAGGADAHASRSMPAGSANESELPAGMGLSVPSTSNVQTRQRRWLLPHILIVTTLLFIGRTTQLSFLPLVLQDDFKLSSRVLGFILAIYPCAALLATPWASALARKTKHIVALHSIAMLTLSAAMALTSFAPYIALNCGPEVAVCWIAFWRAAQAICACLYLSANNSLITRKFPEKRPYVFGLTEVAVGSGNQMGRIVGGFLFDLGGFECAYIVVAMLQGLFAVAGFGLEDSSDAPNAVRQHSTPSLKEQLRWRDLITPRLCVGGAAAFMHFFIGCMFDATGLQYLSQHLAPVSISALSVLLSLRGFTYLLTSCMIARLMHHKLMSFERLILCGATCSFLGQILMAPQPCVSEFTAFLESDDEPSRESKWVLIILATIIGLVGGAFMFVPSLPLMQSEVRNHGDLAMEKASEALITMLSLGEILGPVWGGWIVGQEGFVSGSFVTGLVIMPLWLAAIVFYDSAAVEERQKRSENTLVYNEERRKLFSPLTTRNGGNEVKS